jgi:hypothetical protein
VRHWLNDQLTPLLQVRSGLAVVLDRDGTVEDVDVRQTLPHVEVTSVADWWALRRVYEQRGRRRTPDAAPLVIVVKGGLADVPLPWDVEQGCQARVGIRLPGSPAIRAVLAGLEGDEADRAVAAVTDEVDDVGALLNALAGNSLRRDRATLVDRFRAVLRLVVRPELPLGVLDLARARVPEPTLRSLLENPPDASGLQAAWEEWVALGSTSSWHSAFSSAGGETVALFASGLLRPVPGGRATLPGWTGLGLRSLAPKERIRALLAARPEPWPPSAPAGWIATAAWWGEIRGLAAEATVPEPLAGELRGLWSAIDAAFLPWLRQQYGQLLLSAAPWPVAVHRIAPFLARRLRDGLASHVLLVVLDGMGFAQWSRLRERAGLTVVEGGAAFAMIPTFTSVSRQAIFAGRLPLTFGQTLWDSTAEPKHWAEFWAAQSAPPTRCAYHRVDGLFPQDRIEIGAVPVVGVVVSAVDEVMHGSQLLGDAQVASVVSRWTDTGFLSDLVTRAGRAGFEVWITADHGNLECAPAGRVAEGVAVETSGKRLRRYPNRILRNASAAQGIVWDDIPALPEDADPVLFAPGRLAFMSQAIAVCHGGLSLDEVIVPLVRVTA